MTTAEAFPNTSLTGLPVQLTRFIGRKRELDDLARLIRSTRLLTLTGGGGSGKTRLGSEAAVRAATGFSRLVWVDFGALEDPGLVPQQVAAAFKTPERAEGSVTDTLVQTIGEQSVLLILDNCEHLVDACAELVEVLLRTCSRLAVLATSREALGVPGETAWLVPALATAEAIQLFVERAQAVLPTFQLTPSNEPAVHEICRRLDGIPLAIELAAARVRVLSPEQIAERLSDAFRLLSGGSRTALPRHRTLRGTMEWSFTLLNAREQALLGRLAVFAGSFSLAAAEAVCVGGPLEAEDILDGVSALVDKSLVIMETAKGEARYRLLETVRQYAEERLRETGELAVFRERHARFFITFAEHAELHLFGGAGNPSWLTGITEESGNLRAAAAWAEEDAGRTELALRLGTAIHWYWFAGGQFQEGRRRLEIALTRSVEIAPDVRGRALVAFGMIMFWQGDHAMMRPPIEEALPLLRAHGDPWAVAYTLTALATALLVEGDSMAARGPIEEAVAHARTLKPGIFLPFTLYWHGLAAQGRGEIEAARASFEEAIQIGRSLGNSPAIAHPMSLLGRLAFAQGRYGEAFINYAESLSIHLATADIWGMGRGLDGMAAIAVAVGRHDRGARLLAAAESLRGRIGMGTHVSPQDLIDRERLVASTRAALGGRFREVWSEGMALATRDAVALALADTPPETGEYRLPPAEAIEPVGHVVASPTIELRVRALGPLQIFRGAEPIDSAAWGSARPRELLVFLVMHLDGCTKEQVGLAFWPEASTAQLRNSFHVALHRLRKALGNPDWIGLVNERYRLDPSVRVEFDAIEFEREVTAACRALGKRGEGAGTALERALEWYRGDFLDGEPAGDWHVTYRDNFQRLYLEGMQALGTWQLEDDRLPKAADTFRRLLARDQLHEEAWRLLMVSHARMGERSQALKLHQRLTELLRDELDADPDEETSELYERLQRGRLSENRSVSSAVSRPPRSVSLPLFAPNPP
ncbi:MAG: BTAD domain-containing putative transcriptional regulator [Gemmatimonadota bacterium]